MRLSHVLVPALLALSVACNPSEGGGDFEGGDFAFFTTGVEDACNDGALNPIFLPGGDGSENPLDNNYVAGADELPWTGTVSLPDPFADAEVTVTGDDSSRSFAGAPSTGIDLDADTYADCKVDSDIGVELVISDSDNVTGTATISLSNFTGADCPTPTADPCDVTLDIRGERAGG